MDPQEAYDRLRAAIVIRPELRWATLGAQERLRTAPLPMNRYTGFCYIATEAFCALVPEAVPYQHGRAHFWAEIDEEVWDLTVEQFPRGYDHSNGQPTRFKALSWRAFELIRAADPVGAHVVDLSNKNRRHHVPQ